MTLSVIIPAYNAQKTLPALFDSLSKQSHRDFEVIIVDDCSQDDSARIVRAFSFNLIQLSENHGPAHCRNIGARNAKGDILVFTDSDCRVDRNWLENIQKHYSAANHIDAIMGKLVLMPSNLLGNSISALGFPAGGAIGFENIWRVDKMGFTDSLSSCNCAVRKDIFWEVGGFDETFPYPGGEDTLLAYHLRRMNFRIKYCPDVLAFHEARDSFVDFLKWQFRRGVSSFIFSKKVSNKKDFLSLRIWSTGNILRRYFTDKRFPLVLFMLCVSMAAQLTGFFTAKYKSRLS